VSQTAQQIRDLERVIAEAAIGMESGDRIGSVKVHYSDGSARWLVDVVADLAVLYSLRDSRRRKR